MDNVKPERFDGESKEVRILHLEDSQRDIDLVRLMLQESGLNCNITTVGNRTGFVRCLDQRVWDIILADFALPSFDGWEALVIAGRICPTTPFIFVTGTMGEDIAVESLKSGATDYVLKQKMSRLTHSVRRALGQRAEKLRRVVAETTLLENQELLRFQANHDPLTGLPNRTFFQEQIGKTLAQCDRHEEKCALLFLDVDYFKNINDSLGHSVGDQVLREVGKRLLNSAREHDLVVRLGGDEFIVVLNGVKDNSDAAVVANRIRETIALEMFLEDQVISITCSIGISVFPDDGTDSETLVRNADLALFDVKGRGRDAWQFFAKAMNDRAQERITLENSMRATTGRPPFYLEYQPQVNIATGNIVGVEALIRWQHPELGTVPPKVFIPIAERDGEIIRIGEWVLKTACAQAKQWQTAGIVDIVMAVNVSTVQFRHENFLQVVTDVLESTGLEPRYLQLELTESLFLSWDERLVSVSEALRTMDVTMAIDDFGAGYSRVGYLRHFRFAKLKIDGSVVKSLSEAVNDRAITSAVISIGKILDMKVIAECVETEEQMDFLRSHGCDEMQGYLFSKPLSPSDFADKFRRQQHIACLA